MDCRVAVGLGLSLLVGAAGCTPSASMSGAREAQHVEVEQTPSQKRVTQAQVYVAAGDFYLREAESPDKTEADKGQLVEQGRRAYRNAIAVQRNCLTAQLGMARAYLIEGKAAPAIQVYNDCLKAHPKDAVVWYEMGMAHARLKQWKRAVEALARAVELDADNRRFTNMLGYALAETGAYEDSLDCFRRTVGEARAHFALAKFLVKTNKPDLGREQLHLALRADPTFKEATTMLKRLDTPSQDANPLVQVQFQQ